MEDAAEMKLRSTLSDYPRWRRLRWWFTRHMTRLPRAGTFTYHGEWISKPGPQGDTWTLVFTPPLHIAARTKVQGEIPPPPSLGGPREFDVALTFEPVSESERG